MAGDGVERRLAAILCADVVGYSRLMEADEEATIHALGGCRQVVDELVTNRHGRVFGSADDSVIAEFASAVEAVRCAADIQRKLEAQDVDVPEDRRMREAQRAAAEVLRLEPNFSVEAWVTRRGTPTELSIREAEALRKAGLPK